MEENAFVGFYSKDYGFNVDVPKDMNDFDFKDYTYHLNRGMTQDERVNFYKKPIPYEDGLKIAQRSKDKPEKKETTLTDNVTDALKSGYNLLIDLPTSSSAFIDDYVTGKLNELLYDTPEEAAKATLKNMQTREQLKENIKAETKGTFWGQGFGSVGVSAGLGVISKANPLVLGLFGTLNYEQNLKEMLEQGATFSEASGRAMFGGAAEILSEKAGFSIASKYTKGLLRKYAARFGTESFQELWQEVKDQFVLGKYDTRSDEEQAKAAATSALFGGIGGALGFAVNDVTTRKARKNISKIAESKKFTPEEAKEIGLSVLDEQGGKFRLDTLKRRNERINKDLDITRGNVYDKLVEQGNDPVVAAQKAETLVPRFETIESEIEEIVNQGFKEAELDKLKKDYDEAIRIGGDKADVYLKINDRIAELAKEAGYTEEESQDQRKILTSMFAQWYEKSDMSIDDFWNFLETRLELKDVINEPIVGEGRITQEQIDKELARREQLETAVNIGKKGGKVLSDVAKEWEARFGDYSVEDVKAYQIANDFEKKTYQAKIDSGMSEKQAIIETMDESIKRDSSKMNTESPLFSFVALNAKLPKKAVTSLSEAISLEKDGLLNNEQIRQTTGWFRGMDGRWKLEISDKDAKVDFSGIERGVLSDVLTHDKLFAAYPFLKDVEVVYNPNISAIASAGTTSNGNKRITVGRRFKNSSNEEQRKTIMHEVQHIIQGIEHFAKGSSKRRFRSPKLTIAEKILYNNRYYLAQDLLDSIGVKSNAPVEESKKRLNELKERAKNDELLQNRIERFEKYNERFKDYDSKTSYAKYERSAGEIEARDTAERINLTEEERRKTPVKIRDDAVVEFDDGTTANYSTEYNPYIVNKVTYKGKPIKPYGKGVKGEIATQLAMGKTPNEIGLRAQESINYAKDELARLEPEIAVAKSKISEEVAKDIEDEVNERYGKDFYTTRENPNEQEYLDLIDSKKEYQDIIDFNTKIMNFNFDDFGVESGKLFSRTDRIQGMFDRVNDIVEIAKEHNPDVFLHEMSHVFFTNYLPWLQESGRGKEAEAIYKLVGKDNIYDFTDEDLEKLTETFLQYVKTGNAPNLATRSVFDKAKDWIITQFRTISEDYEVSDEVKDFFDTLISNESDISELANVKTRITDIENSLKQHLNNQEVTFKGRSADDIKALRKAYHKRIPRRKGDNLAEHLRKAGGIEPNSELAKQLGYNSKEKNHIFKKGGFTAMDSLREFLFEEGYLNRNEYDTYEQLSEIESEVENLIDNADNVYNDKNQRLNEERDVYLSNQVEAASVYDDLMKDLGLKSYDEVERVLAEVEKDIKTQNKDISRINKSAIKYIETSMKKARRDIQKTEKDVEKLKEKYANNIANLKQKQKNANETQYVLQQELTDKIRSLPINFKHQNALMKNIARVKDLYSYNRVVEDVMESAEKYADNEMKWLLRNSIDNMLKGTKIKNGKNTNFTYEGGKLFAEMRNIHNMTQNDAQAMLDERLDEAFRQDKQGIEDSVKWTEADKMLNRMLQYRANGMKASTDVLYDLALDLDMMIRNDIKTREQLEELKSLKRKETRAEMKNALESKKRGSIAERTFTQYLGDWHTINNEAFGKSIADTLDMTVESSNQDEYYHTRKDYEIEAGLQAYGLKDKYQFLDKQEELREKKYYIQRNDLSVPELISKSQIMDLFLQMQNPETRELILRNYETISEEGVNLTQQTTNLIDELSDEDKVFALSLAKKLQDDYDIENKAYIRRTGVDMPRIEGYFPRTSDYGVDIDTDYRNTALARPSFYKMRSGNAIPVFRDVIQKYDEHIMEASYAVEMFDKYKEIYLTIKNDKDLQALYKDKYGDNGWTEYMKYLDSLGVGQYKNAVSTAETLIGKVVNNWIAKNIGFNAQVYVKQLYSILNYAENMPVEEYMKNLSYAIAHPKEARATVEKIAGGAIRSRYEKGLQNETIASILKGREKGKANLIIPASMDARFKDISSWFVRQGDITPIIFGGYARIKYLQEQGLSDEEIKKIFITETNRSQQSSLSPKLSLLQKNAGFARRILLAFKNTSLQYTRLTMEAVTQYRRGEISQKQLGKTIITYAVLQRLMYEFSSSLLKGVAGLILGDDEKKKEASPSAVKLAAFPLRFFTDAVPIVDEISNYIVNKASGNSYYSSGIGLSNDAKKAIDKVTKEKTSVNDMVDSGLLISDLITGFGLSTIKRQLGYFVPEKKNKL